MKTHSHPYLIPIAHSRPVTVSEIEKLILKFIQNQRSLDSQPILKKMIQNTGRYSYPILNLHLIKLLLSFSNQNDVILV